ncbi:ATPase inhibitor mai-2, mitochondrial-like [Periplaneta americana]|uniref:ATPase inhibitor mai-2, mitochondrial-like n=1 Tax=Periplaneta americana TaxID=6978 RepID=UPI0037E7DD0B
MNKLPVLNKTFDQIRSMFGFLSKLRYEQQHAASGSRKSRWGGSISESGGALAEMGAVKENEYFYKKDRELLRNLKTDINADIENHKIEIERKNEEIKQLQAKMKEIQNKDSKEYIQLVRQIKYLQNLIQSHNAEIAAVTKVIQDLSEADN